MLEHNRKAYARAVARKRKALGVGLGLGALVGFTFPADWLKYGLGAVLAFTFFAFGVFEFQKFRVFRRDLLERRELRERGQAQ
jgi:hypothetical protein